MTLNTSVLQNDFTEQEMVHPFLASGWARYGNHEVVGNRPPTNVFCGKYDSHYGCLNLEGHKGKKLNGEDCTNKGFIRVVHRSCHKPQCCVCYEDWCNKQAYKIEVRLKEASKRFGLVEHLSASVPPKFFGKSLEWMRKYIIDALKRRGIIGACLIFHGFRYNVEKHWYWSPHFHVLGFMRPSYSRCRKCKFQKCVGYGNFNQCDGFEAVTRRFYESDNVIVKVAEDEFGVKGERKSVFHTALYQLSHASICTDAKRPHAYTWYGVVSYRKMKVVIPKRKFKCPICGSDLVKVRYNFDVMLDDYGHQRFITDRDNPMFKKQFLDVVYLGEYRYAWHEVSGSYERYRGGDRYEE